VLATDISLTISRMSLGTGRSRLAQCENSRARSTCGARRGAPAALRGPGCGDAQLARHGWPGRVDVRGGDRTAGSSTAAVLIAGIVCGSVCGAALPVGSPRSVRPTLLAVTSAPGGVRSEVAGDARDWLRCHGLV